MNKKVIFIILGVLLALIVICAACAGGFALLMSSALESGFEVKGDTLYEVCTATQEGRPEDAMQYFADGTIYIDEEALNKAFPSDYDCEELKETGFIKLLLSGESLSVNTVNGVTTIEYTRNGVTFNIGEREGKYKITSIEY